MTSTDVLTWLLLLLVNLATTRVAIHFTAEQCRAWRLRALYWQHDRHRYRIVTMIWEARRRKARAERSAA